MNPNRQQKIEDLINENKDLIYSLITNFRYYYFKEDLFQVGVIGLIKAYNNFDNTRGVKFSSYAYAYILGEIKKYIREDRGIKVGRDLISLGGKIEKVRQLMLQELKRDPSIGELSDYLNISEDKIVEALNANMFIKSIDEPINSEEKEITIQDLISIDESFDKLELISLKEELKGLSEQEKKLLKLRYLKDKTQIQTAEILNMSQVQVSRKEKKVLSKLRNKLYH